MPSNLCEGCVYEKRSSLPLISPYYGSVTSNALSLTSALSTVEEKNPSPTLAPAVRKGGQQPTLSATNTWGRMIVRSESSQSCKTTPLLQAGESHRASSWAQLCSVSVCFPAHICCRRDRDKPTELHNSLEEVCWKPCHSELQREGPRVFVSSSLYHEEIFLVRK